MATTKIISWLGTLLATGCATVITYNFLKNSNSVTLRYLRIPTALLFPAILYLMMNFIDPESFEIFQNAINNSVNSTAQVLEFISGLALSISSPTILACFIYLMTTIIVWGYFHQNEHAAESTSAILETIFIGDHTIPAKNSANAMYTSNIVIIILFISAFMGIVMFGAGQLLLEGNGRAMNWAAGALVAPGYLMLCIYTIKFCIKSCRTW